MKQKQKQMKEIKNKKINNKNKLIKCKEINNKMTIV